MWQRFLVLAVLEISVVLSGCATMEKAKFAAEASVDSIRSSFDSKVKAPPSQGAGFVPEEQMAKRADLPFNKTWVKQGVNWNRYLTIYIAPVNTNYLMQANWWQQTIRADQMQQDVQNIATFMRTQFIGAFQNDPQHRLRVVMTPERGSLTLEMALTELVPSHVLLNAVKIVGPYGSGLAAAGLERGTEAQCTVAFEARVKDTNTGETLAMFADREYATTRIIDLKGLTWYGNAKNIITTWSAQFVEVANRRPGEIIKPASTFSLKPW
jgi:hypothetical protein